MHFVCKMYFFQTPLLWMGTQTWKQMMGKQRTNQNHLLRRRDTKMLLQVQSGESLQRLTRAKVALCQGFFWGGCVFLSFTTQNDRQPLLMQLSPPLFVPHSSCSDWCCTVSLGVAPAALQKSTRTNTKRTTTPFRQKQNEPLQRAEWSSDTAALDQVVKKGWPSFLTLCRPPDPSSNNPRHTHTHRIFFSVSSVDAFFSPCLSQHCVLGCSETRKGHPLLELFGVVFFFF